MKSDQVNWRETVGGKDKSGYHLLSDVQVSFQRNEHYQAPVTVCRAIDECTLKGANKGSAVPSFVCL
jgi:hypothetical protein